MNLTDSQRRVLLDVARQTIRAALGEPQTLATHVNIPADPALRQPAGCFVSLHGIQDHRLRGCVGRLDTKHPLIEVVQHSAGNVLHDPRFVKIPVKLAELPSLAIEVTVILPLHPVANVLDFDLLSDGVYLAAAGRTGCFLPQVARETGWTKEQLLDRLCTEKLNLPATTWRDPASRLMKFQTLLVGPEPFVRGA